jgi:peroxiredoxin
MCHLQKLYEKYKDRDVVILGFNPADDRKIAMDFLRDNSATFPNILDTSITARKVAFDDYKKSGDPLNYIIDREGKVVDAWYGNEEGHKRAIAALEKAGAKL